MKMLPCSRREFIQRTLLAGALAGLPQPLLAANRPPLQCPPLIEARRGRPIVLTMEEMGYKLDGKHSVAVWGFNGNYLGPTIRIKSGAFAKLNYHNNLPQNFSVLPPDPVPA